MGSGCSTCCDSQKAAPLPQAPPPAPVPAGVTVAWYLELRDERAHEDVRVIRALAFLERARREHDVQIPPIPRTGNVLICELTNGVVFHGEVVLSTESAAGAVLVSLNLELDVRFRDPDMRPKYLKHGHGECALPSDIGTGRVADFYISTAFFNDSMTGDAFIFAARPTLLSEFAVPGPYSYRGQVRDDALDGNGALVFPDHSTYRGGFRRGLREGYGVWEGAGGDFFRGEWMADQRQGTHDLGLGEEMHRWCQAVREAVVLTVNVDPCSHWGLRHWRPHDFEEAESNAAAPLSRTVTSFGDVLYVGGWEGGKKHGFGVMLQRGHIDDATLKRPVLARFTGMFVNGVRYYGMYEWFPAKTNVPVVVVYEGSFARDQGSLSGGGKLWAYHMDQPSRHMVLCESVPTEGGTLDFVGLRSLVRPLTDEAAPA